MCRRAGRAAASGSGGGSGGGCGCACFPSLALVTGPNMGGKSTFIRSVAIAAVMCQAGSFVAAESAAMPLFDAVLCRVGAGDDPLRGVSSFLGEMLQVGRCERGAQERLSRIRRGRVCARASA